MKKNSIAILLPYKENYSNNYAGAASIWVKDYLIHSKLSNQTTVYGNLKKGLAPLTKNFQNLNIDSAFINKNLKYTSNFYNHYLKKNFNVVEIHNRPESLIYLIKKKIKSKKIFVFHNNPQDLRNSSSVKDRIFIANNTDQIFFVSKWVMKKFFEGLPFNQKNNCEVLYPSINPLKNFPRKKNIIIFSGKLNSSKGFDIFGKSILKILDKNKNWRAIAVGNEPREKYKFIHDRFLIKDWINHSKLLNLYKESSISVVPSRWQEPFGRTAMESAAYGCATIISKNGGLPETFKSPIFIEKVDVNSLYKKINFLIKNKKVLLRHQRINFSNHLHRIIKKTNILDSLKLFYLNSNFNIKIKTNLKILHISTFDEKNDHRLFNISIANKISKGLIKNDHDVINFSYKNYIRNNITNTLVNKNSVDEKIIKINENYRPNLIILGHNNFLTNNTLEKLKNKYQTKIILWYEDALGHRGDGPSWKKNLNLIEKNHHLIDLYFTTTHPDEISSKIHKKKIHFLPIPADENIENLNLYRNKNKIKDLFFALSHGVNSGVLKSGKFDEREIFIEKLIKKYPDINYNILGLFQEEPKWNYDYYYELSKCKIALNLSRGKPLKYTSSNRIASLIANGIYTFVDKKTCFDDFFNENEIGFYKNINDLGNKIEHLLSYPEKIDKYAKNGMIKYFKLFNNKTVTNNIIDKTF